MLHLQDLLSKELIFASFLLLSVKVTVLKNNLTLLPETVNIYDNINYRTQMPSTSLRLKFKLCLVSLY